jgi:hypothetical protein
MPMPPEPDRVLRVVALALFVLGFLGLGLLREASPEGAISLSDAESLRALAIAFGAMIAAVGLWRQRAWGAAALTVWSLLVVSRLLWPPTPLERVGLSVQMALTAFSGGLLAVANAVVWRRVRGGPRTR